MDFQHRVGGKTGSGPISSAQLQLSRRQRLLQLAEETQDITKVLPDSLSIAERCIPL